jgi:CheY-like chemotaxis protein
VDDCSTSRKIIVHQLRRWGLAVEEAEDGAKALEKLLASEFTLVVLDVSMPEMDGPTMLAKLRGAGNQTPVFVLTSEARRSIVAELMKLGIDDFILKPFRPDDLRTKLARRIPILEESGGIRDLVDDARAAGDDADAGVRASDDGGSRETVDVLLIDDVENVHKKIRSLLPEAVSLDSCLEAQAALQCAREKLYRVVIVDNALPDVSSTALASQIRALNPRASMVCLTLRTSDNWAEEARKDGYDDVLLKPLSREMMDAFVASYFDQGEILVVDGDSMRVSAYSGQEAGLDRYYAKLTQRLKSDLPKVADACFEEAELDTEKMPLRPEPTVKLIMIVAKEAKRLGIGFRIRGTPQLAKLLSNFSETATVPFRAVG